MDDLELFLSILVTTDEGYFELLIGDPVSGFNEEFFVWPDEKEDIVARIKSVSGTNVYFSPHLFSKPNSHRDYVLPSRTFCVDLDNADVTNFRLNPSYLTETSPGRHQGFWIVKQTTPEFETLSKQLTYTIENADHSGWSLGHKFRIPTTRNYKYDPPPVVRTIMSLSSEHIYSVEEIKDWVGNTNVASKDYDVDDNWINNPPTASNDGPREILEKYSASIPAKVKAYFGSMQADRSDALWALMLSLIRAGATRDEVYWVAKHSENNKFSGHRYNGDRDLAKDVDRAMRADKTDRSDLIQLIRAAEHSPGSNNDRKRIIAKLVLQDMLNKGEFVQSSDGQEWYLNSSQGRPISLSRASEQFQALLGTVYGLNPADGYQPYVVHHLMNYAIAKGRRADTAILSAFDGDALYLHSGKGDVYKITTTAVTRIPDGQQGILFPWRPPNEEIILLEDPISDDWAAWIFQGWFSNLLDVTPAQATLLIRIWFLFILFRGLAITRPILTLLGQPGSGKTTLFHLIYIVLYGKNKSLNAISDQQEFDFACASDPLVCFDNVDSWTSWVADRFALAASKSELVKKKLYTDTDTITLQRQAILGITAHDPKFGRADVVDRLIILNFERRDQNEFIGESALVDRVYEQRAKIWGGIVADVQKIIAEPFPVNSDVPSFRISDFARIGLRIARALGKETEFIEIINLLKQSQTAFTLGEEGLLVDAIKIWHSRRNGNAPDDFVSVGYLWEQFKAGDPTFERTYKTSGLLGRRLFTLQSNLKAVFNVDSKWDAIRGVRTWKIEPLLDGAKDGTTNKTTHN